MARFLGFESQFLMLGSGRFEVPGKRLLIAKATHPAKDHGEAPTVTSQRAIRVGTVDRVAVVDDGIARLHGHGDFVGAVGVAVVGNTLREAE